MIKFLIFDADHTLIEFDDDEKRAFRLAFADFNVALTQEECQSFRDFSYESWEKMKLNDVHTEYVQSSYHKLYRDYVSFMIGELSKGKNLYGEREKLEKKFLYYLAMPSTEMRGALPVVKKLKEKYKIAIATNGFTEMQRERLKYFLGYTDKLFVSEEIGKIKPDKAFFEYMLSSLKAESGECLMIGDSLSSDIAGAKSVNMPCCWFNRFKKKNCGIIPDYEITDLSELLKIL